MVLSFGGFTFAQGRLEFAANPATLQTDIFFHHIEYYGSFVSVKVLVSHQWSQAAEIKVWAENQAKLFACEAGCQFNPVILRLVLCYYLFLREYKLWYHKHHFQVRT